MPELLKKIPPDTFFIVLLIFILSFVPWVSIRYVVAGSGIAEYTGNSFGVKFVSVPGWVVPLTATLILLFDTLRSFGDARVKRWMLLTPTIFNVFYVGLFIITTLFSGSIGLLTTHEFVQFGPLGAFPLFILLWIILSKKSRYT